MEPLKLLGIAEAAQAVGASRAQIDNLKSLTRPDLPRRTDQTSPRRNKMLYNFDEMVSWLDRHLSLSDLQRQRLEDSAVEMLPSLFEKEVA